MWTSPLPPSRETSTEWVVCVVEKHTSRMAWKWRLRTLFIYIEEEKGRDKWEAGSSTPAAQFGRSAWRRWRCQQRERKGFYALRPGVWIWLGFSEMWQTLMTWPRGLRFLRFQIYSSEKPGTSSPLWRNKAGDAQKNERLIQKLEQEKPWELLASPPSAFWPHFCSSCGTLSRSCQPGSLGPGETSKGPNRIRSGPRSLSSCRQNTFRGFSPASQFGVWPPRAEFKGRPTWEWFLLVSLAPRWWVELGCHLSHLISLPLVVLSPVAESSFSIPFCRHVRHLAPHLHPRLPPIWKSHTHIWRPFASGKKNFFFYILFFETQSM